MTNKKISELSELLAVDIAAADALAIVDTSAAATKRVLVSSLDARFTSKNVVLFDLSAANRNTVGNIATFTVAANTFKAGDIMQIMGIYDGPNAGYDGTNNYNVALFINAINVTGANDMYANDTPIKSSANSALFLVDAAASKIWPLTGTTILPNPIAFDPTVSNSLIFKVTAKNGAPAYSVKLSAFALLKQPS